MISMVRRLPVHGGSDWLYGVCDLEISRLVFMTGLGQAGLSKALQALHHPYSEIAAHLPASAWTFTGSEWTMIDHNIVLNSRLENA